MRHTFFWLLTVSLVACGSPEESSEDDARFVTDGASRDLAEFDAGVDVTPDGEGFDPDLCLDNQSFFEERMWPEVLSPVCGACHTPQGAGRISDMVFVSSAVPTYLEDNAAIVDEISRLERDGVSVLLLKPSNAIDHGGGAILTTDSARYALLEEFIARRDEPVICDEVGPEVVGNGLVLLNHQETYRAATLHLAGRLPSDGELNDIAAGGEQRLRVNLRVLMQEDGFYERLREIYADELLTDRFRPGQRAVQLLDNDDFPNRFWYDDESLEADRNAYRNEANEAIAIAPLELILSVVRGGRPFTEILTADYMMVNGYSARSLGLIDVFPAPNLRDPTLDIFREMQVPGVPHAGVLTTPVMLARFPSTDTNRNRHRARIFFDRFLATDILALAEQPISPNASDYHNPTLNDPQCTVCHTIMDPVAGAFQNWDNDGDREVPDDGWFPDLAPPGFGDQLLPGAQRESALRWLATQTAADARFAIATTHTIYEALTGQSILRIDPNAADPEAQRTAVEDQREFIDAVATRFEEENFNVRVIFEDIVMSPWFRAIAADDARPSDAIWAGRFRLRSPERLNRVVESTLGYPWRSSANATDWLTTRYLLLYGGIDSDAVTERLTQPSGLMLAVADRLAYNAACRSVARDFVLPPEERLLFPEVEPTFVPETPDGFAVEAAVEAIEDNIRHLHRHLLDEEVSDEELAATYALFEDVWRDGQAGLASGELVESLAFSCQANSDFWTGDSYGDDAISRDENYAIRAWMAVVTYLLGDSRFLYE
ncbi:MAG: hypothetical protein ACI81R_001474 [Bradymonadia bacterium]|jgi:hypothetical protein